MPYTPPATDAVDFALTAYSAPSVAGVSSALSVYTAPATDAVDFALTTYSGPTFPAVDFELEAGAGAVSLSMAAVESADGAAFTIGGVHSLALAALESSDTFAGTLAGVGSVVSAPVGGGSVKRPRRRHFVIGDKHVIVDDRTELEAVIAMLAATPKPAIEPAKVVRKREPVPAAEVAPIEVAPVEFVPMRIDWAALDVLLRQSIRLEQPEVASVIREMMRRIEDDEDDVEALLLT